MVLWRPIRLSRTNTKKTQKDVLFIIEDWNAKVGSQEIPGVTGKFGLGAANETGQGITEFCQENALVIPNTLLFQQHKRQLYTWTSPVGKYQNQIDYILCSRRLRSSIQAAKTRWGANCGSNHELLIEKFRLKLKNVGKTTRPFRYDLNRIPYSFVAVLSHSVVSDSLWPHGLYSSPGFSVHRDSLGRNSGVGSHALLQGIIPSQGLIPGIQHCRQICYWLNHQESPIQCKWQIYSRDWMW